tara:strand:+ start:36 stop:155 length:120 start_codon:yes stop_codon:yes gene_type:complete
MEMSSIFRKEKGLEMVKFTMKIYKKNFIVSFVNEFMVNY